MKKWQRVKALITKEFYQIFRDPSSILIACIFPLILLFIYGYGVSLDMNHIKLGVVLEDSNPNAESFALTLQNSKFFEVTRSTDQKLLHQLLVENKLHGIVVIPFYFSEYEEKKNPIAPIYVIADGSSPNTASFVQNYIYSAYLNWQTQQGISSAQKMNQPILPVSRFWYNEELDSRHFLIPGSIAIIMTLIGTLLTALVISREWERGTMEALLATPITIRELIAAKMVAYFTLGIGSMVLCTVIALFLYGLPFRGSILVLFLVSSVFLIAALSIGLLISAKAKDQFLASQIAITTSFLPAFMLSGFVFEISSMPFVIRLLTCIIPAKYMVSSLQTLFLTGNVMKLLLLNMLALSLIAVVPLFFLTRQVKKRLD